MMVDTTSSNEPIASGSKPKQSRKKLKPVLVLDIEADEESNQDDDLHDLEGGVKGKGKQKQNVGNDKNKDLGKGKRPQAEEDEDDEDDEGIFDDQESNPEISNAIFSIAKVDLLDPIRPILQGVFNPRPIDNKAIDQLVENMELVGVQSDRYSNAIPILANPDHIDPLSIFNDITRISQAPDLKLSDRGLQEVKHFLAAGGRHRTEALRVVYTKLQEKIKKLNSKIEELEKKEEKKKKKTTEKLNEFRQELKILKAKEVGLTKWTVILYNEETLLADGKRLALELSRNTVEVRKLEDDAEKTTMGFLEYRGQRQAMESKLGPKLKSTDRDKLAKLAEKRGTTDKTLKSCLQSEDILSYWEALASVVEGRVFYNTKYFSSKWSKRTIQQPGGGLFLEIVSEAAHFFRLLFTPCQLYVDEEPKRRKKYQAYINVQEDEEDISEKKEKWITSLRKTTWKYFDNPTGTPDWSMVSVELLEDLDKLNERWLEDKGRYMFVFGADPHSDDTARYWRDLQELLEKYVTDTQATSETQETILGNLMSKLKWYKYESDIGNRLRVPILTPKFLDALAANIGVAAKAYEEIAFWLTPVAPYFIASAKHNLLSRSTWGLVWQQLDVHYIYQKRAAIIRKELVMIVMRAVTALVLIKQTVSSGPATERNLGNPSKGRHFKDISKKDEYKLDGEVYKAMMMCRSGSTVSKSKESQPAVIDYDGLPWPLSAPWSGSFLTSANPSRDFPKHGVYAGIEAHIVSIYREDMISAHPEIGYLRDDLKEVLRDYLHDQEEYEFPDGIETPHPYRQKLLTKLDEALLKDQHSAAFSRYQGEVEDIIKFCSKQSVMLVQPGANEDNSEVRGAFTHFINALTNYNIPRLVAMEGLDELQISNPYDSHFDLEGATWKGDPNLSVMRDVLQNNVPIPIQPDDPMNGGGNDGEDRPDHLMGQDGNSDDEDGPTDNPMNGDDQDSDSFDPIVLVDGDLQMSES